MNAIINWLEAVFGNIPLPLLEVWGRFAYGIGFVLAVGAFGGFTFRPGGRWGFGRERQAWDAKAVLSIPLTFILIVVTGYLGSFIVLVPGAQTFESLKDLVVFLCVVLFGYPALITVPFAYGLSDLIEGVSPSSLLDWLPGYFINPVCFWMAYQLFGKNPDFRKARTWGKYLIFVLLFMSIEPVMWGYICAGEFTSVISYGYITTALFFTTGLTWVIAPFAMLAALPLARRFGMFWAEIPGHVKERLLNRKEWVWEAGGGETRPEAIARIEGWPIRMVLLTPFIALVLLMVGATAYVTLQSAANDANNLATQLHQEISDNINLKLDDYLAMSSAANTAENAGGIGDLLKTLPVSRNGLALVINHSGSIVASSIRKSNIIATQTIADKAVGHLNQVRASPEQLKEGIQFHFNHVTAKPLSRETWLACATAYQDRKGGHNDWIVLTAMPESYYLAGVQEGNSRSAMVFAIALLLSLTVAAFLAALVTGRLRRVSLATQALAQGDLAQRVSESRIEELGDLARSFNDMIERRKNAEDTLREREEQLRLAIHVSNLGLWDWEIQTDRVMFSREWKSQLGYAEHEIENLFNEWEKRVHPDDLPETLAKVKHHLAKPGGIYDVEFRMRHKDGSWRWINARGEVFRDAKGQPVRMLGCHVDITERKALEEQLRQSQKMEGIGQLAGGVAHDFNNILAVIMMQAELMRARGQLPPNIQEGLREISVSAERAANLTRQLLLFSRKQVMQPRDLDLNEIVISLSKMLQRIIGEDVRLQLHLHPTPLMTRADAGMLDQVLMNLAVNARDAMPKGGRLLVETGEQQVDKDLARLHDVSQGRYVWMRVNDTGTGIAPEVLPRIFEPFFTTKEPGKGTGLGLATVFGIAKQHRGWIHVESLPGQGASFQIFVPASATLPVEPAAAPKPKLQRGTETILVVEDDVSVRVLTRVILEQNGYTVLEAANGEQAVSLWSEQPKKIALLLTDLVMPGGVSGRELAIKLQAERQDLKVIFTSGYSADIAGKALELHTGENFVQKPYSPDHLLETVRRCLDG